MRDNVPQFIVVNPGVELSDEAISALGRLLLELASDQKNAEGNKPSADFDRGRSGTVDDGPGWICERNRKRTPETK